MARIFQEAADVHLSKIMKIDRKSDLFTYAIDAKALARTQMLDGKLLLTTDGADHLEPAQIVHRC